MITSVREVNGVDGRVLSSEIFAEGPGRRGRARRRRSSACDELLAVGYRAGATAGCGLVSTPMTCRQLLIVLRGCA